MEDMEFGKKVVANFDQLLAEGIISRTCGNFSMRFQDQMYFPDGQTGACDLSGRKITDRLPEQTPAWRRLHQFLYQHRKDVSVLITSTLPYTMTAAAAGREVPPLLDDFAQLAGVTVRVVQGEISDVAVFRRILEGLKRRNAVLMPKTGGICAAASFDDTLAVAQVLEKGCRAYIDTAFLGGGYRINWVEAWLMRLVFKYKYSKLDL